MKNTLIHTGFSCLAVCIGAVFLFSPMVTSADDRPNVVWIIPDDMSANFSCYGETAVQTPHVDRLAANGVKFTRAFVTAPVCSTCRSAFITGMYQTSIGAHHHRSGRGDLKINLPENVTLVPKLFQDAGYHTSISGWPLNGRLGKTDYNFDWDPSVYDSKSIDFYRRSRYFRLTVFEKASWIPIQKRTRLGIATAAVTLGKP